MENIEKLNIPAIWEIVFYEVKNGRKKKDMAYVYYNH